MLIQFQNSTGQTSAVYKRAIVLDTTAPFVDLTSPQPEQFFTSRTFPVQGTVVDTAAGLQDVSFRVERLDPVRRTVLPGPPVDQGGVNPAANGNFRILTVVPQDGVYRVSVQASDAAGNVRTRSVDCAVDSTPPQVILLRPDAACVTSPVEIRVDVRDENFLAAGTRITVDGGAPLAFTDTVDPGDPTLHRLSLNPMLAERQNYRLQVTSTDRAGLIGGAERVFAVDQAIPTARLTEPRTDLVYSGNLDVAGVVEDSLGLRQFDLFLDGAAPGSAIVSTAVTGTRAPVVAQVAQSRLADGPHRLLLRATDGCGKISDAVTGVNQINFLADNTRPGIRFVKPTATNVAAVPDPADTTRSLVEIEIALDDPNLDRDEVELQINGTPVSGFTLSRAASVTTLLATVSLQDGRHTLRVDAEDTAVPTPNAATATLVFLLDEIAPLAQIDSIEALPDGVVNSVDIPGTILAAGSIEIRGTVVDSIALERVDLRVDGVLFGTDRSVNGRTGAQQVRFTLDTDALADGDHVITLEAVDQAGNVGVSLPEEIETDNTRPDVRILLPAPGQVVRGDGAGVEFDVQVVEPNLRRVTLRVGGTVIREENFPRPGMPLQFVTQIRVRAPIPQGRDLVLTVDAGDLVNNAAPTANRIFTSDTEDPQGAVLTITPNGTAEDVVSTGLEPPVVRGRIRVGARATDSLQIRTIQLLVDGIPVAAMESGPGVETVRDVTFILDTSTLIEGRHTLRLLVTDTALRTNVAQVGGAREILVDRSAPSSILLEPLTEQVRGAVDAGGRVRLNITGRVRDNTGPIVAGNVRMTLMGTVGGAPQTVVLAPVLRPTSAGSTTEFDVIAEGVDITAFQEGALVIELQVTDAVGLTSTGQRRVILNRAGPTVDFRNPDGMQRFLGNSVQRVQFRLNDTTTLPGVGGGAAQPDRLSIANIRVLIFELRQARSGGSFQRGNRVIESRTISDLRDITGGAGQDGQGRFPATEIPAGSTLQFNLRLSPGRYRRNGTYLIQVLGVLDSNGNAILENQTLADGNANRPPRPPDGSFLVFFR